MHRVAVSSESVLQDRVVLSDPKAIHHLLRVARVKVGERLECFDGTGWVYAGPVTQCGRSELTMSIEQRRQEPKPDVPVVLAQALIKPDHFEWAIQKATELGVARIMPVRASRSAIRGGAGDAARRHERWQRIAAEAAAQCGRATIPAVDAPRSFEQALEELPRAFTLLFTLEERGRPLETYAPQLRGASEILVLIGPEGDFSPEEVSLAKTRGAHPASLGRSTLRAETATITALTIVQHRLGVL
jgi:16S rRNA (uracil1498-N3)-methyltransferase